MSTHPNMNHKAFFGDAERTFRLTPKLIVELERKTGVGIGALITRVVGRQFTHADLSETIRLGLIGGGTSPGEAEALVLTYASSRPLAETYPLALAILMALWSGASDDEKSATVADLDTEDASHEPA